MRLTAALALAALLLAGAARSEERIESFEVELFLEDDGDFSVVERIAYDFGPAQRHGIYRDIPVRYTTETGGSDEIDLVVDGVSDERGAPRPYALIDDGTELRIRIGDPERTVSGRHQYWVRYRVGRATRFFEDHDEVYWNATGHAWRVPIERSTARVYLPGDAAPRLRCLAGPVGATGGCAVEAGDGSAVFRTGPLPPGHGLTLVVGLDKGVLAEPSGSTRAWRRFAAAGGLWLLSPFATAVAMLLLWRRLGRDPVVHAAIPVRYDPPDDLSPAEVGTLVDESADARDLSASLLDLAVRGHLEIHEVESSRFLFLSRLDYRLVRRQNPGEVLRPHERLLLAGIFEQGDSVEVSQLRNVFYTHIPALETALYRGLAERGYFAGSPVAVRRRWLVGVVATAAVAAFLAGGPGQQPAGAGVAIGLSGLIAAAFAMRMPRRTRKGRRALDEVLGFKEFVSRVDADRLERLGVGSLDRFERALPYALVLGVADAWAEAFADLYLKPPSWYRSDGPFEARRFVSDLGRSVDTIGSTLRSAPSRVGSSGFGGGGSSGGGFGGGGGGSW